MNATVQPVLTKLRLLIAMIGMMQLALFVPEALDGLRPGGSALRHAPTPYLQAHRPAQLAVLATKLSGVAGAKSSTDPVVGLTGDGIFLREAAGPLLWLAPYALESLHAQRGHHRPRVRGPPVA